MSLRTPPFDVTLVANSPLAEDMRAVTLFAPEMFAQGAPKPGTFVHVKVPGANDFLRRPISIMSANAEKRTISLGIAVKGEGTRRICSVAPGDTLNILGPLGNGFTVGAGKVWLVGGGIGVAPLLYAAQCARGAQTTAFYGFRSAKNAYAVQETLDAGANVVICTEDGSLGRRGYVTGAMLDWLSRETPELILACGPEAMLKAVQKIALERAIPCQLSLEQRMACGVGACLVCNCRVREGDGWAYRRVCKDGPVFSAEEAVFE